VRKFHGIGPATAEKMTQLGIETGLDLKGQTEASCSTISGRPAPTITGRRAASTSGPSAPTGHENPSAPRTRFPSISSPTKAARDALREIVDKVWRYCEGAGIRGRTVTLKVKFANFQIITRSRTGQMQIRTRGELEQLGDALLEPLFPVARGIRLLVSPCLHSRRIRPSSLNSVCPSKPQYPDPGNSAGEAAESRSVKRALAPPRSRPAKRRLLMRRAL